MKSWIDKLSGKSLFFISPDVKRAIGLEGILENYHILCAYNDPLIPILRHQGAKIFCLEEVTPGMQVNNSGKLLEQNPVLDYIRKHSENIPAIIYFKPSLKLDLLIRKYGFIPVGNPAQTNEEFENKVQFYISAQKIIPEYLIPSTIDTMGNLDYKTLVKKHTERFVIQFGHGWAGKTTYFISGPDQLHNLIRKYPDTMVKISKEIQGITILNNCCNYNKKNFISDPAVQISNVPFLSVNPAVTCGRQWPVDFLKKKQIDLIKNISGKIGQLLTGKGFQGIYGLDFLVEQTTGRVYLSEINARMTASIPFFTKLELGQNICPLLAFHISSFLSVTMPDNKSVEPIAGSQIILRRVYNGSPAEKLMPFGIYLTEDFTASGRTEYYPQKLKRGEFIFIKRADCRKKDTGEEVMRIETLDKIFVPPQELSPWLVQLFTKKGISRIL